MLKEEQTCNDKLRSFREKNKHFLLNPIVDNFLSIKENKEKFVNAICNPSRQTHEELDLAFKEFYFRIRFTSYVSTTIHFHGINLDKKIRQSARQFPLQLDQPLKENPELSPKDLLEYHENYSIASNDILEYISNQKLYQLVQKLTINQREILYLAYVKGLKDSEIGIHKNKSQQAVFRSRKLALKKIKSNMYLI